MPWPPLGCLVVVLALAGCSTTNSAVAPVAGATEVTAGPLLTYCDLVQHPIRYLGSEVRVVGIYRVGFEWTELYSTRCADTYRTWVEWTGGLPCPDAPRPKERASSTGIESYGGTFGLIARGTLRGGDGVGYGHLNAYTFQFDVKCTEQRELLDEESYHQHALTRKMRREIEKFLAKAEPKPKPAPSMIQAKTAGASGSEASGEPSGASTARAGATKLNATDGLEYALIPPGSFDMGCSSGDSECSKAEGPHHVVKISKGLWVGRTKVTVKAFARFVSATSYVTDAEREGKGVTLTGEGWKQSVGATWRSPGFAQGEEDPVVLVSWNDAAAFCRWSGGRLPTDAEWEYAARGGSPAARYGDLDAVAWYGGNAGRARIDSAHLWSTDEDNYDKRLFSNGNQPHPARQKAPNSYGLYDTLGNVWEWTADWHDAKYYGLFVAQDPTGPASGEFRVLRGGAWCDPPLYLRVSYRYRGRPSYRSSIVGLRCARDVSP
jgi:sulfatase modifying factor 1